MTELKVCTYNIHSCVGTDGLYSVDRVAKVICNGDADVVCLQEVEINPAAAPLQNRVWSSVHGDDQPELIAKLAGYKYHAFSPAIRSRASSRCNERHGYVSEEDVVSGYFRDDEQEQSSHVNYCNSNAKEPYADRYDDLNMGKFGIAIVSNHPIIQIKTHQYQRYKRKTLRNAMACLILLPNNAQVWIVNTHLGCHFIGKEQSQQAKELVDFIYCLEMSNNNTNNICGVILCGDFNSPPIFPCIRIMKSFGFNDTWCQQLKRRQIPSSSSGGTFPSNARVLGMPSCLNKLICLRLDYMFVLYQRGRDGIIDCKCVYVQDDSHDCALASDHLPLCSVFVLGELNSH